MVVKQSPGKTAGTRLFNQITQPFKKTEAILVVIKNPLSADASDNNMMKRPLSIDSGFAWHVFPVSNEINKNKFKC
jgi:hypothetical protein